jgi:hypothetical protein
MKYKMFGCKFSVIPEPVDFLADKPKRKVHIRAVVSAQGSGASAG